MHKRHCDTESISAMQKKMGCISTIIAIGFACGVCIWIYYLRPLMRLGYVDSAIGTLRMVYTAEKQFALARPERGYACAFADFDANELPPGIATSGKRNGYVFDLSCPGGAGYAARRGFQITARPLDKNMPAYCSDQSGIVRYDEGGSTTQCLLRGTGL